MPSESRQPPDDSARSFRVAVRARVWFLIVAVQAVMTFWVADSEIARGIYMVCYSLMMPAVLYLLAARSVSRFLPFTRQEIMLGYIVLTATLPIAGFGGLRFLLTGMGYISYFSISQPQWRSYLQELPHLPILHDASAIQAFYQGGRAVPYTAWIVPIAFWSTYLLLLGGIWLGLAAVLHRMWIRQERMTFPITVLPIQMTDPKDDLFRRKLFWIGAAIPVVLQSLLALHDWYPWIPAFTLKAVDMRPTLFPSPPWNAIPDLQVGYYPMALGLAYFVPGNISFSCWFFLLLSKLSFVGTAMLGLGSGSSGAAGRLPFHDEQAAGAWIGFALLTLWGTRRHIPTLLEGLSVADRRAMYGWGMAALVCMGLCAAMMMVTGVPPLVAILALLVYVAFVLTGARVRAEAGGMWTFAPNVLTPNQIANAATGTLGAAQSGLIAGGHFDLVHIDMRAQSLPFLLEGLKIADTLGIRWRTVLTAVAFGTVSALALGWYCSLEQFYTLGAATAKSDAYALIKAQTAMQHMTNLVSNRMPTDKLGLAAMGTAAVFTMLLAVLRAGFLGFSLHPVGYVLANTLTMNAMLVPVFGAWLIKTLILRFGGSALYRRSVPFFVGIVLGDILIQALWTLIGRALDAPVYQFLS